MQLQFLDSLCEALHAEAGAFFFLDENQASLIVKKADSPRLTRFSNLEPNWKEGALGACLQRQETVRIENLEEFSSLGLPSILEAQPTSLVCAPLTVAEKALGAAVGFRVQLPPFGPDEQRILSGMVQPIAHALRQAKVIASLEEVHHHHLESDVWQLTHSRNTLRALFDSLPLSIYVVDQRYMLQVVNLERAQRATRPPTLLVGQLCYQAFYQRDEACEGCRVAETLMSGNVTVRRQHGDAVEEEQTEWEIGAYPIYDERNRVAQAILVEQDVSERHRLETMLAQTEKLAAIGQLAAGVAHEINNPLTAILANAQLLQREIPPNDDKQELVGMIASAGARAAQVVRNLLDLARLEQYEFLPTDVNETIQKALDLVRHEIVSHSVRLTTDLADNLPLIRASQHHLQSVWVNLLVNAVDAQEGNPGEIRVTTRRAGNEVRVIIADTGKGIAPEQLPRIFDPFYTTKSRGHGTGLGLSVCDRTIKQHNGRIVVNSQVGVGTEFMVAFPLA